MSILRAIGYAALAGAAFMEAKKQLQNGGSGPVIAVGRLPSGTPGEQTRLPSGSVPQDEDPADTHRAKIAIDRAGRVILKATTHRVGTISERVGHIRDLINKSSLLPEIFEASRAIVGTKCGTKGNMRWCTTPKDYLAEVRAVYRAVQDPNSPWALRYVRDHAKVDQFTRADKILKVRGEDCDGGTILLCSLLMSIGYPVKMRVIQDKMSSSWSHIYPLVGLPPQRPSMWVPMDWSIYPFKPLGWQATGAEEVAKTGKPSGMVTRLQDFDV